MEFGIAIEQCGGRIIKQNMTEAEADAFLDQHKNVWIASYVKVERTDEGWHDEAGNFYSEESELSLTV